MLREAGKVRVTKSCLCKALEVVVVVVAKRLVLRETTKERVVVVIHGHFT